MKRKISVLLLSFFAVYCLVIPCFAATLPDDFSLCDLSSCGITSMKANRVVTPPLLDGSISQGEYGAGMIVDFSTGLFAVSDKKTLDPGSFFGESASQENFVAMDRDEFYLASRITVDSNRVAPFLHKTLGSVYAISFSLGLTPGDHPAERCSFWTNEYYFSSETFACVGVSGERVARSVEEESAVTLRISSLSDQYRENGFTDSHGVVWTAEEYGRNAALSMENQGEWMSITVEIRLPLGDALLSVPASLRSEVHSQIENGNGSLCGSFTSKLRFFSSDALGVGIPTRATCSFDPNGADWSTVIADNFEVPASGLYLPDVIPVPLYLAGDIPRQPLDTSEDGTLSALPSDPVTTETSKEMQLQKNPSVSSETKRETTKAPVPDFSSALVSANDESVFDSLPDEGDNLPEDTERIDLEETAEESNEGEKSGSLVGSVLTFGAGVLMFVSVAVFCIVTRGREAEKADLPKTGQDRKKSPKNSKNT